MSRRTRRQPHAVSEEDRALFREAIGPLRRLAPSAPPPRAAPPVPSARLRDEDEARVMAELLASFDPRLHDPGATLEYLKDGHSPKLQRRLARGGYSIRDELDLHQMNLATAKAAIHAFLDEAIAHGHGCVRIIHGKGWRSGPGGPVLKGLADQLLRRRKDVIAFASAPPNQGGTGAVLVLVDVRI